MQTHTCNTFTEDKISSSSQSNVIDKYTFATGNTTQHQTGGMPLSYEHIQLFAAQETKD